MTDTTRNHTLQNTTMLLPHNKQNSTMQHNHNLNFPFVDLKLTKLLLIAHLLYFQHFFAHGRHARHECRMLGSVLQTQPEAVSEESPAEIVSDDFQSSSVPWLELVSPCRSQSCLCDGRILRGQWRGCTSHQRPAHLELWLISNMIIPISRFMAATKFCFRSHNAYFGALAPCIWRHEVQYRQKHWVNWTNAASLKPSNCYMATFPIYTKQSRC